MVKLKHQKIIEVKDLEKDEFFEEEKKINENKPETKTDPKDNKDKDTPLF